MTKNTRKNCYIRLFDVLVLQIWKIVYNNSGKKEGEKMNIGDLEKSIGYTFKDKSILKMH